MRSQMVGSGPRHGTSLPNDAELSEFGFADVAPGAASPLDLLMAEFDALVSHIHGIGCAEDEDEGGHTLADATTEEDARESLATLTPEVIFPRPQVPLLTFGSTTAASVCADEEEGGHALADVATTEEAARESHATLTPEVFLPRPQGPLLRRVRAP